MVNLRERKLEVRKKKPGGWWEMRRVWGLWSDVREVVTGEFR